MLSCFFEQFYTFIEDDKVENNILKPNPVPSNIPTPAHMDEFLRGVLGENNKYFQIRQDKLFQNIQKNLLNVMGSFSKIWQNVEEATLSSKN